MIFQLVSSFFFFLVMNFAYSKSVFSGKSDHRFYQPTNEPQESFHFDNWVRAEQKIEISEKNLFHFQIYGYAGDRRTSLFQDFDNANDRKLSSELWPGDIYYQYINNGNLIKIGYQTLLWQEGLGLSYTNFINKRDLQSSIFDPIERFNRSSPLLNWIYSKNSLSLQVVYVPFSQFDRVLPVSRTPLKSQLPASINTLEVKYPSDQVADQEWGTRLTWSGEGKDISLFTFELKDRNLVYSVSPQSTMSELIYIGQQKRKRVHGFSASWEVIDHILRFEALQWKNRDINTISSLGLNQYESDDTAFTIAWDSPQVGSWKYSLQNSLSNLEKKESNSFREKLEAFSFLYLQRDLKKDKKIQAQILYQHHDQSIFSKLSFLWPVSKSVEAEIAYEGSSGASKTVGKEQMTLNHTYIQISHVF